MLLRDVMKPRRAARLVQPQNVLNVLDTDDWLMCGSAPSTLLPSQPRRSSCLSPNSAPANFGHPKSLGGQLEEQSVAPVVSHENSLAKCPEIDCRLGLSRRALCVGKADSRVGCTVLGGQAFDYLEAAFSNIILDIVAELQLLRDDRDLQALCGTPVLAIRVDHHGTLGTAHAKHVHDGSVRSRQA